MAKKILVVDDDGGTLQLLEGILTKAGYEVITAKDGLDALVFVEREKPDLIFLDVMIPELNGYDVCIHLKFDERYKNIPIVLLTARKQELNPEIGRKAKIEYMHKPVNVQQILGIVEKLIVE